MDDMLAKIELEENTLVFNSFDNNTALELGLIFIEKGKLLKKPITIDIRKNGHQLFHYSFNGTSVDNDKWIERKNNVVNRFNKSSLYIGLKLKNENKTMEEKYLLSSLDYAAFGGAFPLNIKDTGNIGTITVSGLPQIDDHNLVVEVLKEYLSI